VVRRPGKWRREGRLENALSKKKGRAAMTARGEENAGSGGCSLGWFFGENPEEESFVCRGGKWVVASGFGREGPLFLIQGGATAVSPWLGWESLVRRENGEKIGSAAG
jgi:hypothetical protein